MTARAQRWSWTAVMAVLPFLIVAFTKLSIDVTAWPPESRALVAWMGAFLGFAAATFPYKDRLS